MEMMEFQLSYFKSYNMCCTDYARKFGKLSSGHRTGKGHFSFQFQRKTMPKSVQIPIQLHSFHMLARVCSKIFQLSFNSTVNWELPNIQTGFRKGRGTRDQIANICWIIEKARELKKKSTSASLTTLKPLTVWITTNCGKFLKRWEY